MPRFCSRSVLAAAALAALVAPVPASARQAARPERPSLEGLWSSSTATPLERPRDLADKPFFTAAEAEAWEARFLEANEEPAAGAPRGRGTGTFNAVYREFASRVVKTLRTSIVTEPADGRIPRLTPAAAERRRVALERQRAMGNPEDLALQDRCMVFSTQGPPMLPYSYNSHYQIIQTREAVVVHAEMIHDARVIHLDGRPHPPESLRFWGGFSVGRWEADTLVVETKNFRDDGGFYGSAGGNFSWHQSRRVVERFSVYDPETLLYRFEIDDPAAFVQPWKGELTLSRAPGPILEYGCHEGNYSMEGMLRGARASERASEPPPRR